jgi:hypothetical protein
MPDLKERNAIIMGAKLTTADHGILSGWLNLDYGGMNQAFGGYQLYLPSGSKFHSGQANYAGHFIWRCMEIAGVTEWSELRGKTIRVRQEHVGVIAIGHIIKDDWFDPSADFKEMEARKND